MTQFLYVTGVLPGLSAFPGIAAVRAVNIGVRGVEALLPPHDLERTWELVSDEPDSEVGDVWVGYAMEDVLELGKPFRETKLGIFLAGYIGVADRITISNAGDSVDEATFSEAQQFLRSVEKQTRGVLGKINARYVRRVDQL